MFARLRLILAWGLFVAWVGWLGWQSLRFSRFPVVSRAQLLNANVVIVAEIDADSEGRAKPAINVLETLWPHDAAALPAQLNIDNLPGCAGFSGPGRYILPLSGAGPFHLAGLPRSPLLNQRRPLQVYPDTAEVRGQIQR